MLDESPGLDSVQGISWGRCEVGLGGGGVSSDKSEDHVDIRRLKIWARKNLSGDSRLREVILLDEDRMLPEAYLAKMDVWLALYDIESNQTGSTC